MLKKVIPAAIVMCIAGGYTMSTRKVAHGTCEGGVFKHPQLGITLQLPQDWCVMSDAELDSFVKQAAAQGGGVFAEAERRTALLLVATRYSPKEVAYGPNCMIMCGAEKLPWFSGVSTGEDYIAHARKFADKSVEGGGGVKLDLAAKTYSQTICDKEFDVLDSTLSRGEISIYQKNYVTIHDGNAVFFVLTYFTDADESDLKEILAGLKIE